MSGRRRSHGKSTSKYPSGLPTPWCAWAWSEAYGQEYRYRQVADTATDYEYEYRQPSTIAAVAAPPKLNNYTYAPVEGLATQFAQTSIGSTASSQRHIRTRDPSRSEDPLNPKYKVHRTKDFEFGCVFKILWSEPSGSTGTEITKLNSTKYGETSFSSIRRFVIIKTLEGHSICLPILTYGGRGLLKNGVKPEHHCIIYTGDSPESFKNEPDTFNGPIRMVPKTSRDKLDPASRLNFAKVYTVEHNVKVYFIGKISSKHVHRLVDTYNRMGQVSGPSTYYDTQPSGSLTSQNDNLPVTSYTGVPAYAPRTFTVPYPASQVSYTSQSQTVYSSQQSQAGQSQEGTEDQSQQYDESLYKGD